MSIAVKDHGYLMPTKNRARKLRCWSRGQGFWRWKGLAMLGFGIERTGVAADRGEAKGAET